MSWKEVKLEDITLKISSGSTPTGGRDSYHEEGTPLIRSLNVHDFKFVYKDLAFIDIAQSKKLSNVIVEENDILLNITGASVGRCTMVPNHILPARVNQHVMIVRANKEIVNPNFLLYLINSKQYKSHLMLLSETGATREALTKDDISNFKIKLPLLNIQNKIANILSNYDNLIENNNKQIKLLENMAENLYKEWFVRLRFPNYQNTKIVDGIPEGWEENRLSFISSFVNGYAFKSNDFSDIGDSIIKIKNIGNNTIDIDNVDKVSNTISQKLNEKYKVKENDLLIAMTGATVGKLGLMPKTEKDFFINQRVGKIESKYKYFVLLELKSLRGQKNIDNLAAGAAQPNISSEQILSIKCLIPNESLLNKFEIFIKSIYSEVLVLKNKNQNLKQTRDLLLPRLISGKLDIEDLEIV